MNRSRRSQITLGSLLVLPLVTAAMACASSSSSSSSSTDSPDDADSLGVARQAQGGSTVFPTTTTTTQPTSYPTSALAARIARDHYLKSRLTALRTEYNAPALAGALVVDGSIVSSAVTGVRKQGVAGDAKLGDAFMLKSATKPMTGYLAARIIEAQIPIAPGSLKKFSWTTTILDVFPELARITNPAYVNTTVQALMTHSSGMPYMPTTEGPDEFANITSSLVGRRYEYVKAAVQDAPEDPSPYGGGSIIVAAMLEKIMNDPWEQLMDDWVYADIGMTNSGVGSNPFPLNANQVTSHTRNASGTPIPWNPPSTYASEPHAPAGRNPHASISDFARFAAANLAPAANRPGSLSDASLATALAAPAGVPGNTRSGWARGYWGSDLVLWHNGADGKDYSLFHVIPSQNYATAVMTNVEDPGGDMGGDATSELVAMKRHLATAAAFDDAVNIGESASATSTYAAGYEATKANDGSLLSRWAASASSTTPTLTFSLGGPKSVSKIRIAEYYDRIQSFALDALVWKPLLSMFVWTEVLTGGPVGPNFAASFPSTNAISMRLRITASVGGVNIAEIWAL
jgi:CubicO group peptidase (beta-lactamase class C family)